MVANTSANFTAHFCLPVFRNYRSKNHITEYLDKAGLVALVQSPLMFPEPFETDALLYATELKDYIPVVTPSTAPSQLKVAITAQDEQWLLSVDLDDTPLTLRNAALGVRDAIGSDCTILAYTTIRNGFKGNRYKIIVPLASPIDCSTWTTLQSYLVDACGGGEGSNDSDKNSKQVNRAIILPAAFNGSHYDYAIL